MYGVFVTTRFFLVSMKRFLRFEYLKLQWTFRIQSLAMLLSLVTLAILMFFKTQFYECANSTFKFKVPPTSYCKTIGNSWLFDDETIFIVAVLVKLMTTLPFLAYLAFLSLKEPVDQFGVCNRLLTRFSIHQFTKAEQLELYN